MTDYGLLSTGFRRKTEGVIRGEILESLRAVEGFSNLRTGAGSVIDNLVAPFSEQLGQAWQAAEAVFQSFSPDSASGASLDNLLAIVANARLLESNTTVALRLGTFGATDVLVQAENQIAQSATGTLFETLDDATIPANTLTLDDLDITNIAWQSGYTERITLPTTDLSAVVVGDVAFVEGATNAVNNGYFKITAVNDGANWIEIENLSRSDAASDETGSPGTLTITNGWIDAEAQAIEPGPTEATAYSVNSINTPLSGWDFAVNLAEGVTGRNVESDTDARRRRADELIIAEGGTLEALKNQLRGLDGVTYVSGTENRTDATVDGLPPHSMQLTVVGGADQDIWDCIGTYKGTGIETVGTEVGSFTDPEGEVFAVAFNRVTEVPVHLIVNITKTASLWPSDGAQLVKDALVAYGATLTHGSDLLNFALVGTVFLAAIPGVLTVEVLQGFSDPPTLSNNLTIAADELCVISEANIDVVAT